MLNFDDKLSAMNKLAMMSKYIGSPIVIKVGTKDFLLESEKLPPSSAL